MKLHRGVATALRRLKMDELGIARAMQAGDIASPQRYENLALFKMRITGTGVSYRKALDEFVWRDPKLYLNADFLQRCNGLPLIWEHPKRAMLNSDEFDSRVIGTVFLPFIQDDEVWCIAKVFNAEAIRLMETEQLSTSPAVVFRDPDVNSKLELDDGSTLLVEGKPSLLDHLAVCERGVWDKGGEPNGIVMAIGDSQMAEEKKEVETKADADAGAKLDKVLAHLDSVASMCDSLTKRMDSFEEEKKADKARKDAEEEEAKKADSGKDPVEEDEKPVEVVADKRKDAEGDKEEDKEVAKADSIKLSKLESENAELRKMIEGISEKLPKSMSDAEHDALIAAQARADSVFQAFGKRAKRPLDGETLTGYRRRMCNELKQHSKAWKDSDLAIISADAKTFESVEAQIYADALVAAKHPADLEEGSLREIVSVDPITGQRMSTFVGRSTFIAQMKRAPRAVVGIGLPRRD